MFFKNIQKKFQKILNFLQFIEIFHNFPFPKMKCKNRYQKFQLLAIKKSYSVVKLSNSLLSGTFSKKTVRNETPCSKIHIYWQFHEKFIVQNETIFCCFFFGTNLGINCCIGSSSKCAWSLCFITRTSLLASFWDFLGHSLFKCSTLPQNLQPPPFGYKPLGLSGHA